MSDSSENDHLRDLLLFWPERAIEFLYQDYYNSLLRISERKTHDRKASEDIVQEAFADIWENRQRLAQNQNLFVVAHLFTIVKNKSINFYKRSVWLNESQSRYLKGEEFDTNQTNDSNLILLEEEKPIWRIIATFPQKERECLTLK